MPSKSSTNKKTFSHAWEFSKKLIIFSYTVLFILLVLYFVVEDKSSWATIVCAWIAECGAVTAFYLWKSKNENRAKYAQRFLTKFADKYGADVALHLAEIVLKD